MRTPVTHCLRTQSIRPNMTCRLRVAGWVHASCLVALYCGRALAQEQQDPSIEEIAVSAERENQLENESLSFSDTPDAGPHLSHPNVVLGLGALVAPVYNGSKVDKVFPFPYIDIRGLFHDRLFVTDITGIGVKILNDGPVRAGISISHGGGRDSRDDPHLRGLPDVDSAGRVSGYVVWALNPVALELTAEKRAGKNPTAVVGFGASYNFAPVKQLHLSLSASTTWGDAADQELRFGITPAAAAAAAAQGNPLPAYTAHAGVIDATLAASGVYQFSRHWGVIGRVSITDIVGSSAKNSPLTERTFELSSFALGAAYSF
jgi:outer membrane protein